MMSRRWSTLSCDSSSRVSPQRLVRGKRVSAMRVPGLKPSSAPAATRSEGLGSCHREGSAGVRGDLVNGRRHGCESTAIVAWHSTSLRHEGRPCVIPGRDRLTRSPHRLRLLAMTAFEIATGALTPGPTPAPSPGGRGESPHRIQDIASCPSGHSRAACAALASANERAARGSVGDLRPITRDESRAMHLR